jgi:CHAT domain-containing protein
VEFVRFVDFRDDTKNRGNFKERGIPRYIAFVTQRDRPMVLVELGNAERIDKTAREFRRAILSGTAFPKTAGKLREMVWKPVEAHFAPGVENVYICPDASLTSVPWGTLPGEDGESPLCAEYGFAVVPSGQFLLSELHRSKPLNVPQNLLVVGGVDFGSQPASSAAMATQFRSAVRSERNHTWLALPATVVEAKQVAEFSPSAQKTVLTGSDASTHQVMAELAGARWAHIATHGLFADARFRSVTQTTGERELQRVDERTSLAARNPLLLSGLVFAGANALQTAGADNGADDQGILTAEAISYLPLEHLELAVLSACETGLGDVAGGEGVLGLQRAFHTAGAENVVASLWQVDDQATMVLMQRFYEKLWKEKRAPLQALREAQLELCRSPNLIRQAALDRGVDLSKTTTITESAASDQQAMTPIHLWGAFVLSGRGK